MVIEYVGASPFTLDYWKSVGEAFVVSVVLAIISILLLKKEESK